LICTSAAAVAARTDDGAERPRRQGATALKDVRKIYVGDMGRADEAERILQRALTDVLARAPKGEIPTDLAEMAVAYALRLAAATGRGAWVNYTFELYTTLRLLLPARLVDELYAVARKVKSTDKAALRAYTACLRELSSGFGPAERFIQQRIESFERWAP
jgi:hypothetical protein